MRGLLVVLVLLAAVVLALPYQVLPAVLENLVARDVQDRLDLARKPAVDLESEPQWEMLWGVFSGGTITAENVDLGGVRAGSATIDVDEPFDVDVSRSLMDRAFVPHGPISGRLRLEIAESEVSRLARANASVPIGGIEVRDDGVTVESETSALGTTIPISVDGIVGVSGGDLFFEPRTVEAAGTEVPGWLAEGLLAGTGFGYPVGELPYGGTITGAHTTDGAVVITGRVSEVDLGALPAG